MPSRNIQSVESRVLAAQLRARHKPSSSRPNIVQPSASSFRPAPLQPPVYYEEEDDPSWRYEINDVPSFAIQGALLPAQPAVNKGHFDPQQGRLTNETTRVEQSLPNNHGITNYQYHAAHGTAASNVRNQSVEKNGGPVLGGRAEHAQPVRKETLQNREKASSGVDRRQYTPSRDQANYEETQSSPIPSEHLLKIQRQRQGVTSAHGHLSQTAQSVERRPVRAGHTPNALSKGREAPSTRSAEPDQLPITSDNSGSRFHSSHNRPLDYQDDDITIVKHEKGPLSKPYASGTVRSTNRTVRSTNTTTGGPLKSATRESKPEPVDADIPQKGLKSASEFQRGDESSPGKRKSLQAPNTRAPPTKLKKLNAKSHKIFGNSQSQIPDFFGHTSRNIVPDDDKALVTPTAELSSATEHRNYDVETGQSRNLGLDTSAGGRDDDHLEENERVKIEGCPTISAADTEDFAHEENKVARGIQPPDSEYDFSDCEISRAELDRMEEDARIKVKLENELWRLRLGIGMGQVSPAPDEGPGTGLVESIAYGPDGELFIQGHDDDNDGDDVAPQAAGLTPSLTKKAKEWRTYVAMEDILETARDGDKPEAANLAPSPTKKTKVSRAYVTLEEILEAPPKPKALVINDSDVPNLIVQPSGSLAIDNSHHFAINLWRLLESMSRNSKRIAKPTGTKGEIACFADLDRVKVIELHAFPDWYTSRLIAHFATTTASSRQGSRLLFPKVRSITVLSRGRIELLNFIADTEGDIINGYIENLAYLADPKGLCFDYNINIMGNTDVGHFMQQLETAWPRLRRVSIHQALDELPFIACGLKHQIHYVASALPFTSNGRWMPLAPNDEVDELDDDAANLFSHIDISGVTGYDAWFKEMQSVLEHAAGQSEAANGEIPKYRIIVPGHDNDIIDRFEAGWEKYKADHKRRMERRWDTWRPKQIVFDIDRIEVEFREGLEVQCGICDFTMTDAAEE